MQKPIYLFSTSPHPHAIHINSLEITFFKPSIDFLQYDYFIITSKQAVKALEQYEKTKYKKAICISNQTAKRYEEIGGSLLEIGGGYGDSIKEVIKKYSKSTKWLYLRAEVVASHFVQESKKEGFKIDEIVLYESRCSEEILNVEIQNDAVLIFTSPSSVECYKKNHTFTLANKVVVIGESTAKKLPFNVTYEVAKEPSIDSCFGVLH